MAYEAVTGRISGTREDYRIAILSNLVGSFMGIKEPTSFYVPTFAEQEHNEQANQLNQKAFFQSISRKPK